MRPPPLIASTRENYLKLLTYAHFGVILNTVNTDFIRCKMRTEGKLSVYESIVERIRRDIALGIIAEGERLPSCRDLAIEAGVNPNTVQRAYSTLEEQGIIYTIPKKGVYARGGNAPNALREAEQQLRSLKAAGVTREQLENLIDSVFSEGSND